LRRPGLGQTLPGVPQALARLRRAGFRAFIVTNQSGIGRGLITEAQYDAAQQELLRQIGSGLIEASYFCPDVPGTPSTRRKPEPGMVLEAAAAHGLDLPASWLIGDKSADTECGRRAGLRTIVVATGYGCGTGLPPGLPSGRCHRSDRDRARRVTSSVCPDCLTERGRVAPGTRIDSYRIESLLGADGMRTVHQALDIKLTRPIAIKFLSGDLADASASPRWSLRSITTS
jgi:histidinol-phosphate phosphatase family protein